MFSWETMVGNPGWGVWLVVGMFGFQMLVVSVFILVAVCRGDSPSMNESDE